MSSISLYLITGLSGSGKSHALQSFEDMGFYCVDNLPFELVVPFLEGCKDGSNPRRQVAIAVDVREEDFEDKFPELVEKIRSKGIDPTILFMEARDSELLNRYKESRRPHPLGDGRSLDRAIEEERRLLQPVRERSDNVIDTSDINIHELRGIIMELHNPEADSRFTLTLVSFGYKYGVPGDLDMLFDARFLPNPHYEPEIQDYTGMDQPVREFLNNEPAVEQYLSQIQDMLGLVMGAYYPEGKAMITVGIGCTGGKHRSVYLAETLNDRFQQRGDCRTIVRHRDVDRTRTEQADTVEVSPEPGVSTDNE
ncbi:MAG: RNase adapter RapZ [bacterium]